jgi:hypothetical protein
MLLEPLHSRVLFSVGPTLLFLVLQRCFMIYSPSIPCFHGCIRQLTIYPTFRCFNLHLLYFLLSAFLTAMCKLIHYKFCVESSDMMPPKDELERCSEWAQLVSNARKGDVTARKRLRNHIECERALNPVQSHP